MFNATSLQDLLIFHEFFHEKKLYLFLILKKKQMIDIIIIIIIEIEVFMIFIIINLSIFWTKKNHICHLLLYFQLVK